MELYYRQCRGGAGISKVVRPLHIKDDSCMADDIEQRLSVFFGNRKGQELVGSLRIRPTRRARLRSETTASSGMRHIASSCTSYTHVYLAKRGCRCSPVGPRRLLHDLLAKQERFIQETPTRWAKASLRGTPGPTISLACRPSLQSGNETNDLLKSGPALAGPAGPATPPLQ